MIKRLIVVCLAGLLLAGCGYGFRGTVNNLPSDIKSIAIPYLQNDTNEGGLQDLVTQALIKEFNRSKLLKLTSADDADCILKGSIVSVSSGAVAFDDVRTAKERRVVVRVNLVLTRTHGGQVLFQTQGLTEGEDYDVTDDSTSTEDNRQEALKDVSDNLAMKIHDAVFENF